MERTDIRRSYHYVDNYSNGRFGDIPWARKLVFDVIYYFVKQSELCDTYNYFKNPGIDHRPIVILLNNASRCMLVFLDLT